MKILSQMYLSGQKVHDNFF